MLSCNKCQTGQSDFKKNLLKQTFLGTLAFAICMPAIGQDVANGAASAQEQEGDRTLETVVVTGSRAVIQNSIEQKRNSIEVVDGLSAADIGELPALSIGEALENITGAASHRENGGATEISIRGLGPYLSSTTFNGREASNGSGDRSVNFSQFPSELMSKVAIAKTQAADYIEGGVAGQIQLETIKPLDYGKQRFQFDLKGNVNPDQLDVEDSMSGDMGYRGTVSYVDQYEFDNGSRLGVSIGAQRSDISQPEQEWRSSSPTGTSHRACLADPNNFDLEDPTDLDDDAGRGFSNLSDGSDDCEDFGNGNDSVDYNDPLLGNDNSTGYDTRITGFDEDAQRVSADDLGTPFVFVPNERGYRQNDTSDTRDALFATIQFQPNDRLDINIDAQWSERIQEEDRHDIGFTNSRRNTVGVTYDSLDISDLGSTSSFTTETQLEARGETYNRTETYKGLGLAVSYDVTDDLTLSADISSSETTRTEQQLLIRTQTDPRALVSWNRDASVVGNFVLEDFDVTDHSLFIDRYRARIDNDLDRTNKNTAARFDLEYNTDWSGITSLEAGVRASKLEYYSLAGARDEFEIRNDRDNTYNGVTLTEDESQAIIAAANSACAVDFQEGNSFLESIRSGDLFTNVDEDGNVISSGNSWASFDTVCMVNAVTSAFGATSDIPALEANSSTIDVTEDTLAAYVKANYDTTLSGIPVRGNFGVRMVNTEVEAIGIRNALSIDDTDPNDLRLIIDGDVTETASATHDYTEFLPSLSFVADLSDDHILRGGMFRGMTRADPADMGFGRVFAAATPDEGETFTSVEDIISNVTPTGNPAFDPLMTWNYDISFEWYPNEDSILAIGGYYKSFQGGFENVVTTETFNIDGVDVPASFVLSQTNEDTSTLYGVEITGTHHFSYLPEFWNKFGVKASLNIAESDFEFQDSNYGVRGYTDENGNFVQTHAAIIAPANVPGFSDTTASAQIYYSGDRFDTALIYKYRSDYFQPYTSNGTRIRYVDEAGVLEARASYKLNENFTLTAEALNILDEERTDFFYTTDNVGQGSVYGPRIFFGVRGKF